jgi:colanic acid/amylovoran biosynthesis glycosyltransferase
MDTPPVIGSYCGIFLRKETKHVYRQLTSLQRFQTVVFTGERQNKDIFPFPRIVELPAPEITSFRRFSLKYFHRTESLVYRGEYGVLVRALRKYPVELLHVYFGHVGAHLTPFIRRWNRPTVVSFHGMDVMPREHDRNHGRRMRDLFAASTLILARSQSLAEELTKLGCPADKIRLNPTGLPLDDFPFRPRKVPEDGKWRLIQVCRFIEKKGLYTTLEAFAGFCARFPQAILYLVGEGPLESDLRDYAEKLNIADRVCFCGFLQGEALLQELHAAHLFLHPSKKTGTSDQEGIPNSMLEAMATGLPVAATKHGGIPEAVTEGDDGFLTPEGDAEALRASLFRMTDPGVLPAMSRAAGAHVRERFGMSNAIHHLENAYSEAIEQVRQNPRDEELWKKWEALAG